MREMMNYILIADYLAIEQEGVLKVMEYKNLIVWVRNRPKEK